MIKRYLNRFINSIKKNQFASKLMKNVAVSFIGEGGAAVIAFITMILLIVTIGDSKYGLLTIANSYILIVDSIINFQSWQTVIKFGSEDIENNNISSLEKLIKVCSIVDFSTAVIGGLISISLAPTIVRLMGWDLEICKYIYILSVQIFFNFTGTSIGVVRLFDKFKYYSIYRIFAEIIRFFLVVIFCNVLYLDIKGAVIAFTLSYVVAYIIFIFFFVKVIRDDTRLSLKRILTCSIKDKWKSVLGFSMWTNLSASADIPVQQFDLMLLSLISTEIVAVFKVYKQIGAVLNKLMTPLKQAVMPLYSEFVAKRKYKECYICLIKMKDKTFKVLIPVVIVVTAISLPLLDFILGELYSKYWYILLIYLLLRTYALSYATIHSLFIALGEVRMNFVYTLLANIVYIIITCVSIRYIGIWAILIGMAIQYISLIFLKKKKILKMCL